MTEKCVEFPNVHAFCRIPPSIPELAGGAVLAARRRWSIALFELLMWANLYFMEEETALELTDTKTFYQFRLDNVLDLR